MPRFPRSMAAPLLCLTMAAGGAGAQATPKTGHDLLQRMHDAYAGRWYHTLTFVQQTTRKTAAGGDTIATWYESLRWTPKRGGELRIDIGQPTEGNGILYTPDSLHVMRGGSLAAARAGGNEFITLIEDIYLQPVARSEAELAQAHIDFGRPVLRGSFGGQPVFIAGAASASDTTSPQIWVDVAQNAVVRAILPSGAGSGASPAPMLDARLERLVPLAGGLLATKCTFYLGGVWIQTEEYRDWKANVDLADALFDVATYATAPHWATLRTP